MSRARVGRQRMSASGLRAGQVRANRRHPRESPQTNNARATPPTAPRSRKGSECEATLRSCVSTMSGRDSARLLLGHGRLHEAPAPHRSVGGLRRATQSVSGAPGEERKEANTRCARRDLATGSCPTPGMAAIVELGSVRAAIRAGLGGVTASNVPERRRVGMVLRVTARCAAGASGTSQMRQSRLLPRRVRQAPRGNQDEPEIRLRGPGSAWLARRRSGRFAQPRPCSDRFADTPGSRFRGTGRRREQSSR
jgi:hypothetical protein